MNSFSDGETLTAGKLNTNFNTLKTAIESLPNWSKSGTTAVRGYLTSFRKLLDYITNDIGKH
jgi:hypothetical protein